jgi:ADP-heptose:LPS heptosyltransferase
VLVTSGPSDHDAAARVVAASRVAAASAGARIVDAEGLSLPELRALMDRAALFVGGDSGPLHVAATSDVAVVGLFGPTLPERSAPWRPPALPTASIDAGALPCRPCHQRTCVPGDFRCLTSITPEDVGAAAERLLEARP